MNTFHRDSGFGGKDAAASTAASGEKRAEERDAVPFTVRTEVWQGLLIGPLFAIAEAGLDSLIF